MVSGMFKIVDVVKRSGNKNGKDWEMIQVTALDCGKDGPALSLPIEFNLDEADKPLATTLKGLEVKIALTKVGVFNGRSDISARVSKASYDNAYKAAGSPPPQVLGAPVAVSF